MSAEGLQQSEDQPSDQVQQKTQLSTQKEQEVPHVIWTADSPRSWGNELAAREYDVQFAPNRVVRMHGDLSRNAIELISSRQLAGDKITLKELADILYGMRRNPPYSPIRKARGVINNLNSRLEQEGWKITMSDTTIPQEDGTEKVVKVLQFTKIETSSKS